MSNDNTKEALPFLLDDAAIIDIDHTPYPRSEDALKEVDFLYHTPWNITPNT